MKSFNITMPAELLAYVRERTKQGGFGTPTEFMRHLIRRDQDEEAERRLERLLLEGARSPKARGGAKGVFQRLRKRLDELDREGRERRGSSTRRRAQG